MEKPTGNLKTKDDEYAVGGEMGGSDKRKLPQNNKNTNEKLKSPSTANKKNKLAYKSLVANMDELRIDLEKRRVDDELYANNTQESASYSNKNVNEYEKSAKKKEHPKNNNENYVLSFEQLVANAKVLTDNEINEYEMLKQNEFYAEAEKNMSKESPNNASSAANYSSEEYFIESSVQENHELEINEDTDISFDMEEGASSNVLGLAPMGFGFFNLHDEVEWPTEYDQGAIRKFFKNFHNSLIKNQIKLEENDNQ